MTRTLPPNPNLGQLRKQAKDLLKAYRAGDPSSLQVLQHLPALRDIESPTDSIQPLCLADAQFALAREYGFTNWAELKAELLPQPDVHDINDHHEPFFESSSRQPVRIQRRKSLTWLEPIPRFPLKLLTLDAAGRPTREVTGPRGLIHSLGYAMRMLGHNVPLHAVMAAAGESFRFTFSAEWHPDAKATSPLDAVDRACRTLGFEYERLDGLPWSETCRRIDEAIEAGRPVLAGTDPVYWHILVGIDRETDEYVCIGGDPWNGQWPAVSVGPDERAPESMAVEDCLRFPRPARNWYARFLGPDQVLKNPAIILGERRKRTKGDVLRDTLRTALEVHRTGAMERRVEGARAEGVAAGCHALGGTSPGTYITGLAGLRQWAAAIEALPGPSHDPKYIQAHDIDLGEQLMFLAEGVRNLRIATGRVPAAMRQHLRTAVSRFADAEQRSTWQAARQCLVNFGCHCTSEQDVRASQEIPSLVTIYPPELEGLLRGMGLSFGRCWLGLSVLPNEANFRLAKRQAVENILAIADLRERACVELRAALETTKTGSSR